MNNTMFANWEPSWKQPLIRPTLTEWQRDGLWFVRKDVFGKTVAKASDERFEAAGAVADKATDLDDAMAQADAVLVDAGMRLP